MVLKEHNVTVNLLV